MLGLLKMAKDLAERRTSGSMFHWDAGDSPLERRYVMEYPECVYPCTREYYRILDSISRGEKP